MHCSRIAEILFGISGEPLTRAELIEKVREAVRDENYITEERLAAAFERMLDEIQSG